MSLPAAQLLNLFRADLDQWFPGPASPPRRVTAVTSIFDVCDLDGCGTGEMVVLLDEPTASSIGVLEQAVGQGIAALILRPDPQPEVLERLKSMACEHGVGLAVCAATVDPRKLAISLSRSLAGALPEAVPPELQTEGTLQGLAESLGRLVGNSVTIETPAHDLLASSPTGADVDQDRVETILHRRAGARIMDQSDFKQFFARVRVSDWPLRLPPNPELGHSGRIAMRIVSDSELFGVIWVTDTARPLSDADFTTIRQAAAVAAAIFVRQQLASGREARLRAELLDEVIAGRIANPENIRTIALSVGWNVDRLQLAMVVSIDDVEAFRLRHTGAGLHRTEERLMAIVSLEVLAVDPEAVVGMRSSSIIVLFDVIESIPQERKARVMRVAESIVNRSAAFLADVKLTVGVGREFADLEHMAESFRQAELAATLGRTLHGGNLAIHYEDLGIHRVLYSLRGTEGMITPSLQRIVDHDAEHGTEYAKTLSVYLKNLGRLPRASRELNIHRNTLEYRMTRITEIAGIDLDDPDSRLALELGIRVLQIDGVTA